MSAEVQKRQPEYSYVSNIEDFPVYGAWSCTIGARRAPMAAEGHSPCRCCRSWSHGVQLPRFPGQAALSTKKPRQAQAPGRQGKSYLFSTEMASEMVFS